MMNALSLMGIFFKSPYLVTRFNKKSVTNQETWWCLIVKFRAE